MFPKSFLRICAIVLCLLILTGTVTALEVDCDSTYCFSAEDFSAEEAISGICITGLPDPKTGTVMLGSRGLRAGDILAADQLEKMTFLPLRTERTVVTTMIRISSRYQHRKPLPTVMRKIPSGKGKRP